MRKLPRKVKEACRRKMRFASMDDAWAATRRTMRNKTEAFRAKQVSAEPVRVRPFKCPVCKAWHIGTPSRVAQVF